MNALDILGRVAKVRCVIDFVLEKLSHLLARTITSRCKHRAYDAGDFIGDKVGRLIWIASFHKKIIV